MSKQNDKGIFKEKMNNGKAPKAKGTLKGSDFPVAPKLAPPGTPLPVLPDVKRSDFVSTRQYQNAQARKLGYSTYSAYNKVTNEAGLSVGTGRNITGEVKEKRQSNKYRNKQTYKLKFNPDGKGASSRYDKLAAKLNEIVYDAPDDFLVQLFIKGNSYGGARSDNPEDWDYVSRLPERAGDLKREAKAHGGVLEMLRHNFDIKDVNETNRGVEEIQVAFYNLKPKKGGHVQGRK